MVTLKLVVNNEDLIEHNKDAVKSSVQWWAKLYSMQIGYLMPWIKPWLFPKKDIENDK